jgi:hypothetical protein
MRFPRARYGLSSAPVPTYLVPGDSSSAVTGFLMLFLRGTFLTSLAQDIICGVFLLVVNSKLKISC